MSDLFPVAGAKIYIGPAKAAELDDFVAADFTTIEAGDWDEIDGWETCGDFGDAAEIITTALINRGRDVKQKGTRNAGDMENRFAVITGDDGMAAVLSAEATKNAYAFRIIYDDLPGGTGASATTQYFVAKVGSVRFVNGGANTIRMRSVTLAIDSNIVTVDAVVGT